jgi:hypothetical protein
LEHERNCRNSDRKGNHRSKSRKLIIVQSYLERGHNWRSRRRSLQSLALAEMVMSTQLHDDAGGGGSAGAQARGCISRTPRRRPPRQRRRALPVLRRRAGLHP